MPYTGEVTPGGPADTRTAGDIVITKVAVDPEMSNNCYLLRCVSTGDQVLIDAAAEPGTLLPLIGDAGLTSVVTTHQHWDHHRALAEVVSATGAQVVAGRPRRRGHHEADRRARHPHGGRRRHRRGRRLCPLRHRHRRPHARLDRPGLRGPRRPPAPVHRRLALPRRRRQHREATRTTSAASSTTWRPRSSRRSPTTRGSTPATATTRPSASSARTWPSGASGAGSGPDPGVASVEEVGGRHVGRNHRHRRRRRLHPVGAHGEPWIAPWPSSPAWRRRSAMHAVACGQASSSSASSSPSLILVVVRPTAGEIQQGIRADPLRDPAPAVREPVRPCVRAQIPFELRPNCRDR